MNYGFVLLDPRKIFNCKFWIYVNFAPQKMLSMVNVKPAYLGTGWTIMAQKGAIVCWVELKLAILTDMSHLCENFRTAHNSSNVCLFAFNVCRFCLFFLHVQRVCYIFVILWSWINNFTPSMCLSILTLLFTTTMISIILSCSHLNMHWKSELCPM